MANMLDRYEDAASEATIPTAEVNNQVGQVILEKPKKLKKRKKLKKKLRKLRKTTKALHKRNKLLEAEVAKLAAERAAERAAAEKASKDKISDGVKGFLSKLGNAVCKAVPKILEAVVTLAFSFLTSKKLSRKAPQPAGARMM